MKRILTFAMIVASTYTAFSQSLGYNDLGILFSKDDNYGTARFEAMSGAFGALGGDISSFGINPAGSAVALKSTFGVTLGNRNTEYSARYYGNTTNTEDDFFNITQAGGILSFESTYNTDWTRFALTFNYRLKSDFEGVFSSQGNSGQALFNEHPDDTNNQFNNGQEQRFNNSTYGESSVFEMGFSAVHQNKLYAGASIKFHNFTFGQITRLREVNEDNNGNTLTALNIQDSYFEGSGVSLSAGFIYKVNQSFRFGLAYETPTWYPEIFEDSNLNVFDPNDPRYDDWLGYTEISATNQNTDVNSGEEFNSFVYKLRTPSKLTASAAFVFGKQGLISADYTYKNYSGTKYDQSDSYFSDINQNFKNDFEGTHSLNIGTEWRFDKMSIRGGYHFEENPYKNALDEDHISGFSLGLGYNFGNIKFDLSYTNSENNSPYNIYNSPNVDVNPIELTNNTSRISGTISFSL
ncbi:OmpP1/FadL family transporter [Tenacibaculum caenipelagi]|uniref:Outer membrane protein transport protein (OMPP1/FadL/TodX) n=1 Tax=Tenacibaculum caenipelagi TaxID=1325435 RepID=A0A4R6T9X5_9FLAO|nr:outer membrane protein transport protein [Tenacibaculum caenipelagi]TDQ22836.1 outer membrane protein transport protein (OMPP1/FadL/TodX) [Tenacibaculum caenipelagi]